jgi:SAM-dependent methyltransferase
MEHVSLPLDPLKAKLPEYGIDWRFLLPMRAAARTLILSDTWTDSSARFADLEMQAISCHTVGAGSDADPWVSGAARPDGEPRVVAHPAQLPFAGGSFDAVVIPFGIPKGLLAAGYGAGRLSALKRLLRPGGTLLLGFSNRWGFLRRGRRMGLAAGPASITRLLSRAGFGRRRLYAAVPNLDRPAYIFPLDQRPLQFFLRHGLLGKRGAALLRVLPIPILTRLMPGMLPSYFVVAGQ